MLKSEAIEIKEAILDIKRKLRESEEYVNNGGRLLTLDEVKRKRGIFNE